MAISIKGGITMRASILAAALLLLSGTAALAVEMVEPKRAPENAPVCGGLAGFVCGDKEWCDFPDAAACGSTDQFGTCETRPEVCAMIFMPVCGCDGMTYGNSCQAHAAGFDVAYAGACRSEVPKK